MACKCAKFDSDSGRYECSVSGSGCMYLIPNSKRCAEEWGEGPDVKYEEVEKMDKNKCVKLFKCNEDGVTEWCFAESKQQAYEFMKDFWGPDTMKEYEDKFEGSLDEFINEFFVEVDDNEDFTIVWEHYEVTKRVSEWIKAQTVIPSWFCFEDY